MRKGVRPGEGATREVIAYVLDHGHFSGVPATAMVSLRAQGHPEEPPAPTRPRHRKVGSFQKFVPHEMDCEEMGPSKFPVLVIIEDQLINNMLRTHCKQLLYYCRLVYYPSDHKSSCTSV